MAPNPAMTGAFPAMPTGGGATGGGGGGYLAASDAKTKPIERFVLRIML